MVLKQERSCNQQRVIKISIGKVKMMSHISAVKVDCQCCRFLITHLFLWIIFLLDCSLTFLLEGWQLLLSSKWNSVTNISVLVYSSVGFSSGVSGLNKLRSSMKLMRISVWNSIQECNKEYNIIIIIRQLNYYPNSFIFWQWHIAPILQHSTSNNFDLLNAATTDGIHGIF